MCSLVKEISFLHPVPVLWVRDRCWFCFVCSSLSFQVPVCLQVLDCSCSPMIYIQVFSPHLLTLLTHSDFRLNTRHRGSCFHCFLHRPLFSWSLLIFFFFDSFLPLPGFYFPNYSCVRFHHYEKSSVTDSASLIEP